MTTVWCAISVMLICGVIGYIVAVLEKIHSALLLIHEDLVAIEMKDE
jgi:hypothetical protein